MKKILFTENQLKHILGEDFISYLPSMVDSSDYPSDSEVANGGEVITKDTDGNETPTLDKISKEKTPNHPFFRRTTYGTYCESNNSKKKVLTERNKELDGKKFHLGKGTQEIIDDMASSQSNDKMINNMSNEKGATINSYYVRLNRLNKMKKEDPERFNKINGKKLINNIKGVINNAKNVANTVSDLKQDANQTIANVTKGTGKGHHKDGGTTIYYENN